jgi:hypothetical protein
MIAISILLTGRTMVNIKYEAGKIQVLNKAIIIIIIINNNNNKTHL